MANTYAGVSTENSWRMPRRDQPASVVAPDVADAVGRREQADEAAEHQDERRQAVDAQASSNADGHRAGEELPGGRQAEDERHRQAADDDDLLDLPRGADARRGRR